MLGLGGRYGGFILRVETDFNKLRGAMGAGHAGSDQRDKKTMPPSSRSSLSFQLLGGGGGDTRGKACQLGGEGGVGQI